MVLLTSATIRPERCVPCMIITSDRVTNSTEKWLYSPKPKEDSEVHLQALIIYTDLQAYKPANVSFPQFSGGQQMTTNINSVRNFSA